MNVVVVVRHRGGAADTLENVYDSWDAAYIDHPDCIANFTRDGVTKDKTPIEVRIWKEKGDAMIGFVLPVITLADVREHAWKEKA